MNSSSVERGLELDIPVSSRNQTSLLPFHLVSVLFILHQTNKWYQWYIIFWDRQVTHLPTRLQTNVKTKVAALLSHLFLASNDRPYHCLPLCLWNARPGHCQPWTCWRGGQYDTLPSSPHSSAYPRSHGETKGRQGSWFPSALDWEREMYLTSETAPPPPPMLHSFSMHVSPGFAPMGVDIIERNMACCKFCDWAAGGSWIIVVPSEVSGAHCSSTSRSKSQSNQPIRLTPPREAPLQISPPWSACYTQMGNQRVLVWGLVWYLIWVKCFL